MRAATRILSIGLLLPCSLYTYSGAHGVCCTGGFGMRSKGLFPDGLVEWSLLIGIIGLERTTYFEMNDPRLQRMALLLRRGARSALLSMVRSLLFPVVQGPHIKPFFMGFITDCLLFYPFHIPSCSSSASQRYVPDTILQVIRPGLGRSYHHVLQAVLQVPFPCLCRSCLR